MGNIWLPCASFIGTAIFLVCASWRCLRSCAGGVRVLSVGSIVVGLLEIVGSVMLLRHYAGTMDEAFDRCVNDLKDLAAATGTSYQGANLIVYIATGVCLLAFNIAMGRYLMRRWRSKSIGRLGFTACLMRAVGLLVA